MRRFHFGLFLAVITILEAGIPSSRTAGLSMPLDFGNIPLYFVRNQGQVEGPALFYAKTRQYTLWMTEEGLVFDSILRESDEDARGQVNASAGDPLESRFWKAKQTKIRRDVSRLVFLNARPNPKITDLEPTDHRVNIFLGNDSSRWKSDIPASRAVLYTGLYPGIDLKIYGVEKQIEYDWVVKPGGGVADIRFEYQDVESVRLDEAGNLIVKTQFGEIVHRKPLGYQTNKPAYSIPGLLHPPEKGTNGESRIPVGVRFMKRGATAWGFETDDYDKTRELVIDPVILGYSTYFGGESRDIINAVAVDGSGCAYVTGRTVSLKFPLKNPIQDEYGGNEDIFVAKFSSGGSSLIYSTYLGGTPEIIDKIEIGGSDEGKGIAVDGQGAAFITGNTSSKDFPIINAIQKTLRGRDDAFVTKLSPSGKSLIFSTYLGGGYYEYGKGIAVGADGSVFVTGATGSANFPLKNPFRKTMTGYHDGFVTRLAPTGNARLYSTFFGGGDCSAIAVDGAGNAFLTGCVASPNFPLKNPFQSKMKGPVDVFISKLAPSGRDLVYSTYLGGSDVEGGTGIVLDDLGCAYVTGMTRSSNFPLKNPVQNRNKAKYGTAFVSKISPSGQALVYSTYLGGSYEDQGLGIGVDNMGCAYAAGETYSNNFPLKNPLPLTVKFPAYHAFVSKLVPGGDRLAYSTYLGGSGWSPGYAIAADPGGAAYVGGYTSCTDFPVKHPFRSQKNGPFDGFLSKLVDSPLTPMIRILSPNGGEVWKKGSAQTILWKTAGKVGNLRLAYSTNAGTSWMTIAPSVRNTGRLVWTIPNTPSKRCLVRVREAADGDPSGISDEAFSIVK